MNAELELHGVTGVRRGSECDELGNDLQAQDNNNNNNDLQALGEDFPTVSSVPSAAPSSCWMPNHSLIGGSFYFPAFKRSYLLRNSGLVLYSRYDDAFSISHFGKPNAYGSTQRAGHSD